MLAVTFDEYKSIVILEPSSSLSQEDFEKANHITDGHLVLRKEIGGRDNHQNKRASLLAIIQSLFNPLELFQGLPQTGQEDSVGNRLQNT